MAWSKFKVLNTVLRVLVSFFLISVLSFSALAVPDQVNTGKRLEEVKRALGKAQKKVQRLKKRSNEVEQDLAHMRRDMVAAAKIIQVNEFHASELIKALSVLQEKKDTKSARLAASRGHMSSVLVALQRFARYPPEALMMQPISPADTVRSAILLRAAVPEIKRKAFRLREDLESLNKARSDMVEKQAQLASVTEVLEGKRKDLVKLFGKKTVLKHRTLAKRRSESRRLKSLAKEASSLSDLLNRLNKERLKTIPRPAFLNRSSDSIRNTQDALQNRSTVQGLPAGLTGAPISGQRGKLPTPVIGRIVGRFGQTLGTGLTRKGMKLQTASGAQVVAPYEGRIVYAGNFRGYGELLIIEHGEGYHSLLSGLSRIDSTMGQWVVSGEPVGVMGSSDRRKPILYVELRRNSRPINPLPWLSATK